VQYDCNKLERVAMIPTLQGIHHLKLPVSELQRSIDWYGSRLGYQVVIEFREGGERSGVGLAHPAGGPDLSLVQAPDRARAAAGFDYFAIGVPDRAGLVALADHLTTLGEEHAGVHPATLGWILPMLHDPDGHEVRFYSMAAHTSLSLGKVMVVDDAVASARAAEQARLAAQDDGL
jgi:catechol-2,3-dioxygenase